MSVFVDMLARDLAFRAHAHQTYGDGPRQPYTDHLTSVVNYVFDAYRNVRVVLPDDVTAAAWLHDILEDTPTTEQEVEAATNAEVRRLVTALTRKPDQSLREYHAQIRDAGDHAIVVKLADRLANVEHSWRTRNYRLFNYYNTYPKFRVAMSVTQHPAARYLMKQLDVAMCDRDHL